MSKELDSKKTIKAGTINILSNIISMMFSLISLSVLSNLMSLSDMGVSNTFITLQAIISYIITLSIYTSINKIMLNKEIDKNKYFTTITIFTIIMVALCYLIYYIFKEYFNNFLGFNTLLMTFLFLTILFDNILLYFFTKWTFNNSYIKCFIYEFITSPLSQVMSILLVCMFKTNLYWGKIIGLKILPIISGLFSLVYILIKGKFAFDKKYLKYGLQISSPIVIHLLSQILLSNSNLILLQSIKGADQAGLYSIAFTIGNVLYMAILCILKPWSPWVYRRMEENDINTINKGSKYIVIFEFILTIGIITIAPEMIKIFLNEVYHPVIYIMPVVFLGMFFQGIYILFYDIEYFHKKTSKIALYSGFVAIFNIVMNYIFIKFYGYVGVAYVTFVSYSLLSIVHYFGMKKVDKRKIYDMKTIIVYSVLLILLTVINLKFKDFIMFRYTLFIVIFIILAITQIKNIKFIFKFLFKNKT